MGRRFAFVIVAAALCATTSASPAKSDEGLKLDEATLPNGLHVVVDSHARVPLVSVVLSYRAGTAQDPPGRRGLADLTMWLMTQRTQHVAKGRFMAELGAFATRWHYGAGVDRTTFSVSVPPNALERVLWMLSDAMGFFDRAVDDEEIRDRLRTLRDQRTEHDDSVAGLAVDLVQKTIYPPGHPYRLLGGDPVAELAGVTPAEVAAFHDRWFVPRNASLVVAGDANRDDVMRLAKKYFGTIPGGAAQLHAASPAVRLGGQTWFDVAAPVHSTTVVIVWPTPAHYASGDAEMDSVAGLLDGLRTAHLRWELDTNKKLVTAISAAQDSSLHGSLFVIAATVKSGHTAREVVDAVDAVLRDLQNTTPTDDEVSGSVVRLLCDRVYGLERADRRANMYAGWLGDVGIADYLKADLGRYDLTPALVERAARTYLPLDRRVITVVEPDPSAPPRGVLRHRTFTPVKP
jgi:zinc protease